MTDGHREGQEWWSAVKRIAHWVIRDGIEPDEDGFFRAELSREGFSAEAADRALAWIDQVELTGNLIESLAMLAPSSDATRVEHPVERAYLPENLIPSMEGWRVRGVVSQDLAERVLEGVRTMDTRDWDAEDVLAFMSDVVAMNSPHLPADYVTKILRGRSRDYFC